MSLPSISSGSIPVTPSTNATPFTKILIANRGEIALRIIRTARLMGYRTVAVHSAVDANGRHVNAADQAVCIGEAAPASSYLNIAAIIEAARRSGADAVHPGYGFLAENAEFAQACKDAGLVFIGPSPHSMISMGNKAGAKDIMGSAGVPCVPGYQGLDQSDERMFSEAKAIGFPVMIKATAGGGGRGMRLVNSAEEFADLLRGARSEAKNAFGDDNVILERALVEPRHIEIQIMADRYGHAIHLGERDCSVQRRHQKVIEEAPSPAIDALTRKAMGDTAVTAAKAIGYEGAGTLEFLLDADGKYYFMEMNTRLQVEHPVTELVNNLDLVELQLRIAAGEPLALAQTDVKIEGHAIEVRLCAEDPNQEFMPRSGTMRHWQMPATLRVEDSLYPGAVVSPFYDSMIAKLVSHGRTREEARRKLVAGLESAIAVGVSTNQAFLLRCLEHPVFAAGDATTGFIAEHLDQLLFDDPALVNRCLALGALLLACHESDAPAGPRPAFQTQRKTFIEFDYADRRLSASVAPQVGQLYFVGLGELRFSVEIIATTEDMVRFTCGGLTESASYARNGDVLLLQLLGRVFQLTDKTRAAASSQEDKSAGDNLRAAIGGRVVEVSAKVGDVVAPGHPIITVEAMKMEYVHRATASGRIIAIHGNVGDQVAARSLLVEFELENTAPE